MSDEEATPRAHPSHSFHDPDSDAARQALQDVLGRVNELPYEELVAGFRDVERQLEPLRRARPDVFLEVQRRVAEHIVLVAVLKEQPLPHVFELLEELIALGWTDLRAEAQMVTLFARYCLKQRNRSARQLGLQLLLPVYASLSIEYATSKQPWIRQLQQLQRRLLRRLARVE